MYLVRFAISFVLFINYALSNGLVSVSKYGANLHIKTIHGDMIVDDPMLIKLIESEPFQRLKKIRQHGLSDLNQSTHQVYYRYDHSIGAMVLLAKYGASLKTQTIGLLHDISHTAFSHAADPLFLGSFIKGAYQDLIHLDFLKKHGIGQIIRTNGYDVKDMEPEHDIMMDQPSPALCADRLEYNLVTGFIDGHFTQQDLKFMEDHLYYKDDKWFFDDIKAAKMLAMNSIWETENRWGSPISILTGIWTSEILAEALRQRLIIVDDIEYLKSDDALLELFEKEGNSYIKKRIEWIKNPKNYFAVTTVDKASKILRYKYRGIDPLVKLESGEFKKLSDIDDEFKSIFEAGKKRADEGWPVAFKNGASMDLKFS